MYLDDKGIPLDKWESIFGKSKHKMDIDKYIQRIQKSNLPNSILIDCTADEGVSQKYREIFQSNISIVTANKKANSANYKYYNRLRKDTAAHNVKFLYETNVGSAMPIINTIQDIIATGDRITRIEGVLSGTLSYIFNIFDEKRPFSQSVLLAQENGFTEPDPREDLNGKDVARKLLILIRECGYSHEFRDIKIENLIPKDARKLGSIKEFFAVLKKNDPEMEKMRKDAQEKGKVLRYIATFANGKADTGLKEIGPEHPFYILNGNENIVSIYTNYYKKYPLTIRGPGAGAELTAAGVLADVLRVSRM